MLKQNRELKNRVREIRSHGSVRGQGRNGLALLGNIKKPCHSAALVFFAVFCLHLGAAPLYVATNGSSTAPYDTWVKASTNIQWAVGTAVNGDTVWISNGVYVLTNQITVTNNITVNGTGTGDKPVVDGNNAGRCFEFTAAATGVLANLFITRGYTNNGGGLYMRSGTLTNCVFSNNTAYSSGGGAVFFGGTNLIQACTFVSNNASVSAGGLYLVNTLRSTVIGCVFYTNLAGNSGGGMMAQDQNKNTLITDCDFICNVANKGHSGGGYFGASSTTYTNNFIVHCTFASNIVVDGDSGGAYLNSGNWVCSNSFFNGNIASNGPGGVSLNNSASLKNCIVARNVSQVQSGNYGGGGIEMQAAGVLVQDCIIEENRAGQYGGGIYFRAGILRNCLIRNNTARTSNNAEGRGGGVRIEATSCFISSCTIASNYARTFGGGIYNSSVAKADNSIIYFNQCANTPASSNIYDESSMSYSNCCISGFGSAAAVIRVNCITNQNPQLVDFSSGNYRLKNTSPCINAGTNQAWMTGAVDLDGRTRIRYGTVDMGAYERINNGTICTVH